MGNTDQRYLILGASMLKRLDVTEILAAEQRRGRNRRATQIALVTLAAVVVAGAVAWGWWTWQSRSLAAYVTDRVTRGDLVVSLIATGTLEPSQKVGVSSLIAGTLASVDVDYNETVSKGQRLGTLDPRDYIARRERALAAVAAQVASRDAVMTAVTDAEATLQRARELPRGEVVSSKDVELAGTALIRAQANLAVADAQLNVARADLASAQSDYDKTIVVSPIDGTVLDVNAVKGQTVSAATLTAPLFTIASDLKLLGLDVDIDEADVVQVRAGDPVLFTVEAQPDKPIAGTIQQVRSAPSESDGVTSYTATIDVDNPDGLLRPGMTATASIETDRVSNVLTVANAALRFVPKTTPPTESGHQVYVLRDGTPLRVVVTTGLTDGTRTAIASGDLAVGDLVVAGIKDR